jgi:ABC-type sugar transport system ATPase subunit
MTLGDRIGLFKDGRLVQAGTPPELYHSPASAFAGAFIGSPPMNILEAVLEEGAEGPVVRLAGVTLPLPRSAGGGWSAGPVQAGIRPEHMRLCGEGQAGSMAGEIAAVETLGRENLVHLRAAGRGLCLLTTEKGLKAGQPVLL